MEGLQRGEGIGLGVDRADLGAPARRIAPIERGDLGFLDASGVGQHVGAQIDRAARRKDPAGESLAHELRQQAAVIDMRMGQQHGIDVGGAERKCAIVQRLQRLRSLKQPAVDEETSGPGLEQMARAGHGAGRAAEPQGDAHRRFSGLLASVISACKASTNRSSSAMAFVGCGTLSVERMERMPDCESSSRRVPAETARE